MMALVPVDFDRLPAAVRAVFGNKNDPKLEITGMTGGLGLKALYLEAPSFTSEEQEGLTRAGFVQAKPNFWALKVLPLANAAVGEVPIGRPGDLE